MCCGDCLGGVATKFRGTFKRSSGEAEDTGICGDEENSAAAVGGIGAAARELGVRNASFSRRAGAPTTTSSSNTQVEEAIGSMIDDVLRQEPKIPTFDWRFRRGYGTGVVIGPVGAQRVSRILGSSSASGIGGDGSISTASKQHSSSPSHRVTTIEWQSQLIGDVGASAISLALSANKPSFASSITSLNISSNGITATGASVLAEAIKANPQALQKLVFCENPIQSTGVEAVCRALAASTSIRQLEIGTSDGHLLSESATLAVKELIANSPSLVSLKLQGHDTFTCASLSAVLKALELNKKLAELSLLNCLDSSVQISQQVRMLINTLAGPLKNRRSTLMTLELRLPLGDGGAAAIGDLIRSSVNLRTLIVAKCSIGVNGLTAIGKSIAQNRSIAKLDLSVQDVSLRPSMADQGLRPLLPLFQSMHTNRGLVELNVSDVVVSDADIEELCAALERGQNNVLRAVRHAPIVSESLATKLDNLLTENGERIRQLPGALLHQQPSQRGEVYSPASSQTANSEASGIVSPAGAGAGAADEYTSFGMPGRNNLAVLLSLPKKVEVREDQMVDLVIE